MRAASPIPSAPLRSSNPSAPSRAHHLQDGVLRAHPVAGGAPRAGADLPLIPPLHVVIAQGIGMLDGVERTETFVSMRQESKFPEIRLGQ